MAGSHRALPGGPGGTPGGRPSAPTSMETAPTTIPGAGIGLRLKSSLAFRSASRWPCKPRRPASSASPRGALCSISCQPSAAPSRILLADADAKQKRRLHHER